MTERIPLLVFGLLCSLTLYTNVSSSVHHCTPRARSVGRTSWTKSRSFNSLAQCSAGMKDKTFLLLLTHLVRLKPPSAYKSPRFLTKATASSSVNTDLKQSSTFYKLCRTVSTAAGAAVSLLSSAVLRRAYEATLGEEVAPERCTAIL